MNSSSPGLTTEFSTREACEFDPIIVQNGSARVLRKTLADDVRELSKCNPLRLIWATSYTWLLCMGILWYGSAYAPWWLLPLVIIVLAARQHALGVLMHEVTHYRFLKNRALSDFLGNICMAYPILFTVEGYRTNHLAHHSHLNSDEDPDWQLKKGKPEWEFPQSKQAFLLRMLRLVFFGGIVYWVSRIKRFATQKSQTTTRKLLTIQRVYYLLILGAVCYFGAWMVLGLWIVPLFTILPAIARIRSIAEHFGMSWENDFNMSRSIECSWLERFLIGPFYIHYHLEHHLYPSVPFHNLPALHKRLRDEPEFAQQAHMTTSYFFPYQGSLLQEITEGKTH